MWNKLAGFILRYRVAILIAIAGITAFMIYQAWQVKIAYNYTQLLPETDSSYIDYANFQNLFGQDGKVMIGGMQADSLYTDLKEFNDWYELDSSVRKIGGIENVLSVASLFKVENDSLNKIEIHPLLKRKPASKKDLDSIKQAVYALPFFGNYIFNRQKGASFMLITFKEKDLNTIRRIAIVDSVKTEMDAFGAKHKLVVHYSGMPYIRTILSAKIKNEMVMFLILALLVTSIILLLVFRSFYLVIFPILVAVTGVVWTIAIIHLFGYPLAALNSLIGPIMIVIGVPNCILLLNKYHTEFRIHGNKMQALQTMISKIGISLFLANVTTAIGFAVFCSTRSTLLVQFGLVASVGIMCTYLISLFLIPIIFSYLPSPRLKQIKHLDRRFTVSILSFVDKITQKHRKLIYAIVIVSIAVSVIGIFRIKALGFVVDDLPKNDPIYTDMHYFESCLGGVIPLEIKIDTRKPKGVFADNGKALYKMERLQRMLSGYSFLSRPLSVNDGLKFANQAYHEGNPKYYIMPTLSDLSSIKQYASQAEQKQDLFKSFLDTSKQYASVNLFMADVGSAKIKTILAEIEPRADSIFNYNAADKTWLPADQRYKVTFTGSCLIFLKGNNYLVINLIESVLLAIILVSLVMYLLFMSARMVIISTIPSLIPLVITLGLMGFFNVHLKPSTILIFSIAFGISSDGTMYFLTKYKQDMKKQKLSISEIVSLVIKETGVSMIYTALILSSGFMIFIFSGFGGTRALGLLVSVTLLMAYSSNLIVLPAFLLSLEKRLKSKGKIKSLIDMEMEGIEEDNIKDAGHGVSTETEKMS